MNKKAIGTFIAVAGIPLSLVVAAKVIDAISVNRMLDKIIAYNGEHPQDPLQFSVEKK